MSFRDVQEMMAARGIVLTYETVRCWCDKFGSSMPPGSGDVLEPVTSGTWTRVFLKINGVTH